MAFHQHHVLAHPVAEVHEPGAAAGRPCHRGRFGGGGVGGPGIQGLEIEDRNVLVGQQVIADVEGGRAPHGHQGRRRVPRHLGQGIRVGRL